MQEFDVLGLPPDTKMVGSDGFDLTSARESAKGLLSRSGH